MGPIYLVAMYLYLAQKKTEQKKTWLELLDSIGVNTLTPVSACST